MNNPIRLTGTMPDGTLMSVSRDVACEGFAMLTGATFDKRLCAGDVKLLLNIPTCNFAMEDWDYEKFFPEMVTLHQAAAQGSQTILVCSKSCAGKACHADTLIFLCQKPAPLKQATLVSIDTFADCGGSKEALKLFVNRIIAAGNLPEQRVADTMNDNRASIATPSKTRSAFDFFPSPLNEELVAIAEPTTSNEPITIYVWAENMTHTELEMITSAMYVEAKAATNAEDNAMEYEFAIDFDKSANLRGIAFMFSDDSTDDINAYLKTHLLPLTGRTSTLCSRTLGRDIRLHYDTTEPDINPMDIEAGEETRAFLIIGMGARLYNKPAKVAALKDFILKGVILADKFPAASNQLRILKGYSLVKRAGATASCGLSFLLAGPSASCKSFVPQYAPAPPLAPRALSTQAPPTHSLYRTARDARQLRLTPDVAKSSASLVGDTTTKLSSVTRPSSKLPPSVRRQGTPPTTHPHAHPPPPPDPPPPP